MEVRHALPLLLASVLRMAVMKPATALTQLPLMQLN